MTNYHGSVRSGQINYPSLLQLGYVSLFLSLHLLLVQCAHAIRPSSAQHHQVYIVYLGHHAYLHPELISSKHHELLGSVKGSLEEAIESLLYSYKHSFSGFSAKLTAEEALALSTMPEVTSVFLSQQRKLHTTRSWNFLGVYDKRSQPGARNDDGDKSVRQRAEYGKDTVIGVLDTGIWPESESFNDNGMGSVPESWKGVCEAGDSFNSSNCNRKLIGARMYIKAYEERYGPLNTKVTGEFRSPRDKDGHGTHTASTAAGREVPSAAALGGFGRGTASGGADLTRLAVYKVCWPLPGESPAGDNTCADADMLAAFDDAVADGVDVVSVSIGSASPQPAFFEDSIAIGALHAARYGVLVSCSGGNDGPKPFSVGNLAPWILTVAASSVDRTFLAPAVTLGNGRTLEGETVTPGSLPPRFYPLIFAGNALIANTSISPGSPEASLCLAGSLDPEEVKGKIVFCSRGLTPRVSKGEEVLRAGGAGMILANRPGNGDEIAVDAHLLPATAVRSVIGEEIVEYLKMTAKPVAKLIPPQTHLGVKPSPFIAAFSSRGPNSLNPDILKPDISAPGLNILAAWSGDNSPTKLASDPRRVKYNIFSGTSMACPHVSGTAALLRAIHPSWSPAAIKSALMTTASVTDSEGRPIVAATGEEANPFLMGAGEIYPTRAADPGLVYDATMDGYGRFLCDIGYNESTIKSMVGSGELQCRDKGRRRARDLNLASVVVEAKLGEVVVVERRVTNVGTGKGVYKVAVYSPPGASVEVVPHKLVFTKTGQMHSFQIKFNVMDTLPSNAPYPYQAFGSFIWSDGQGHTVRSPIALLL